MKIVDDLTYVNYENKRNKIEYIVIHYTANKNDTAAANTRYFRTVNRNASAHYFVDENEIRRCVPDEKTAWSVGAKSYIHKYCRNYNSISIELCTKYDGSSYYFDDRTVANAVELTRYLADKYSIPTENILRHYDVTGKLCPLPYIDDNKWKEFLKMTLQTKCKINGKELDSLMLGEYNYIKVRDLAEVLGLSVSYDKETKSITIK